MIIVYHPKRQNVSNLPYSYTRTVLTLETPSVNVQ